MVDKVAHFCSVHSLVFFFQAEDGIRDPLVTGVQTCALPISASRESRRRPWRRWRPPGPADRSEEHTSELQSRVDLVCRLLLEKKKKYNKRVGVKQTLTTTDNRRKVPLQR